MNSPLLNKIKTLQERKCKVVAPPSEDRTLGFIVLCPDRNFGGLKNTINSIRNRYEGSPYLTVVGNNATPEEMAEMTALCPQTLQGGDTITSLMNTGLRASTVGWNILVFAGSWLNQGIRKKFHLFARDKKDILFPVVDWKINFIEGSMNGIILHQETFLEVGDFSTGPMQKSDHNELELIKMFWAVTALEKGCKFKAIIGMKVC